MKKIIVILSLFTAISLFPVGYDFSIGAGYGVGVQGLCYFDRYFETIDNLHSYSGLYQQVIIPITLSFYPDMNNNKSIGFINKLGYKVIVYGISNSNYSLSNKHASDTSNRYDMAISYSNPLNEYEISENLSLILKSGNDIKFLFALGCSAKVSFLYAPDVNVEWNFYNEYNKYICTQSVITPGLYTYFSAGPSIELGFELINKPKTFCVDIGFPLEFQIPLNQINITEYNVTKFEKSYNVSNNNLNYNTFNWGNLSIGMEFTFNFYTFKDLTK